MRILPFQRKRPVSQLDWHDPNVRHSFYDAATWSVMVGLGETYLPAFMLAAGLGAIYAGWIATVPLFVGAVVQLLILPYAFKRINYRNWVLLSAALQGAVFLPLVIFAWTEQFPLLVLFTLACLYWTAAYAGSPAWNAWMDALIPAERRPYFFALRSRLSQIIMMVGFIGGGFVLQQSKDLGVEVKGFITIFLVALVARSFSIYFLSRQEPREPCVDSRRMIPFREFAMRLRASPEGKFIGFIFLSYGAVYVAAPFFTPYMLTELKLDYTHYVALIAVAFLGKAAAYPFFAKISVRLGVHRLLLIAGLGVAPLAALWLISDNFLYLLFLQIYSGVIWGAYELAIALFICERMQIEERASLVSYLIFMQSTALMIGSLAGGGLLHFFGQNASAYAIVFFVSSVLRTITILPLFSLAEVKPQWRIASVRALHLPSRAVKISDEKPLKKAS